MSKASSSATFIWEKRSEYTGTKGWLHIYPVIITNTTQNTEPIIFPIFFSVIKTKSFIEYF